MNRFILLFSALLLLLGCSATTLILGATTAASNQQPDQPIIGILTMPNNANIHPTWGGRCYEYVQTTYVSWLEAAGVRAVVIRYDQPAAKVLAQLAQVQGALFTGGMLDLYKENDRGMNVGQYVSTAKLIYDYANSNSNFVLWGTCQGFQLISLFATGIKSKAEWPKLNPCIYNGTMGAMMPLDMSAGALTTSRLYKGADGSDDTVPKSMQNDLTVQNSTSNLHNCGISPEVAKLMTNFTVLSTNNDYSKPPKTFVSSFESKKGNIYMVQYHPEAAEWWWSYGPDSLNINKKPATIRVSQFLGHFVAAALRKATTHVYSDDSWKKQILIDSNFPIVNQDADQVMGFYCVSGPAYDEEHGGGDSSSSDKARADAFAALFGVTLTLLVVTAVGLCWVLRSGRNKREPYEAVNGPTDVSQA